MRLLSAPLFGCLLLATAPLQAALPPADIAALAPQEATQWAAKDLAGIWDFTIGPEGDDAFQTDMVLKFAENTLSGTLNLGSAIGADNLKWDIETGTLSFELSLGADYLMKITMTRDGDTLVGNINDGEDLDERISAVLNVAKTKAVAEKAAAIVRGEVFEGVEVGDRAPDIVGIDLDGVDFKLSDYDGKVLLLDFWGDW